MDCNSLFGTFFQFITCLLVIAGWVVVYKQNLALKERDEIESLVNHALQEIIEVQKLCEIYYGKDNDKHIGFKSNEIKAKFMLLSHYLMMLKNNYNINVQSTYLNEYKKVCTGNHFETINFSMQIEIPDWMPDLSMKSAELRYRIVQAHIICLNNKKFLFSKKFFG